MNSINHYSPDKNLREILRRVIHDVRSPLASLIILTTYSTNLPAFQKECLNNSIDRIKRIIDSASNSLLLKNDNFIKDEFIYIDSILEKILLEKKIEYIKQNIKIEYNKPKSYKNLAIRGSIANFESMLSNLLNNSAEACLGKFGMIKIHLSIKERFVYLTIRDNGKGMPKDILKKIRKGESITYEKENGHGIGLGQIRDTLDQLNSKFKIYSKLGMGTKVSIKFNLY